MTSRTVSFAAPVGRWLAVALFTTAPFSCVRQQIAAMQLREFIARASCDVAAGAASVGAQPQELQLEVATAFENATEAGVETGIFALTNTTTLTRTTTVTLKLNPEQLPNEVQCRQVRNAPSVRAFVDVESGRVVGRTSELFGEWGQNAQRLSFQDAGHLFSFRTAEGQAAQTGQFEVSNGVLLIYYPAATTQCALVSLVNNRLEIGAFDATRCRAAADGGTAPTPLTLFSGAFTRR